jgi:glycosyltransferase involved in cell wall biosynthesis
MKIAILAPVPVPYERGAVEQLWWNLARHFNERTRHQAEFLKLPCDREDVRAIVRGYQAFGELDLGGFDAVISGQPAAWMARHARHSLCFLGPWMGAADDLERAATMPEIAGHAGLASLVAYMRRYRGTQSAVAEFFARWSEIAAPGNAPDSAFDVNGRLTGAAVRWLDEIALGAGRIARYAAVGGLAAEQDLFPDGAAVAIVNPPAEGETSLEDPGWSELANTLLATPAPATPRRRASRKLLLASTFGIHPPRHGGQSRIYHLYRALAPEFETVIVSVRTSGEPAFEGEIAPGVREVRVPLSPEHERRALEMAAATGTSVIDVTMPELHALTPELGRTLEREAEGAIAAIASHPYLFPALVPLGLPLWYEAHNLELDLKRTLFADRPGSEHLVAAVDAVEGAAARGAEWILCSSPDDARTLVERYGADARRILDVPNGTDASRIAFTSDAERERLRARLGLEGTPAAALFMGSGHWPNLRAAQRVFEFAAALPQLAFVVMGGVGYNFDPRRIPQNVLLLGEVDEVTRNLCLQACDVALNPMEHGSGTNLKMLDFFAAGLPAISTERGARGLRLEDQRECLVRSIEDFPAAIEEVVGSGREMARQRAESARSLVEREFDWDAIATRLKARLPA